MNRILLAAALLVACNPSSAATIFGTLSNFDVFNDTGQITRGFEIELRGITSGDISYTFNSPYIRYSAPSVVSFAGGVFVRYQSRYDPSAGAWVEGTPVALNPSPTAGHQCWTGGMGTNYATSGCEHFGLAVNGSATSTQYRWLIEDPANPGMLKAYGTNVAMAAPIWTVTPPANPAAQPVVNAVVRAPEPVDAQFGEAVWVKVFKTEQAEPAELEDLVSGSPAVPDEPAETEIEWVLLQAQPGGGGNSELENAGEVGEGNEAVVRRYEYYKYIGAYDPEDNEALNEVANEFSVGDYIGAQMGAVNLNGNPPQVPIPEPESSALIGAGLLLITVARRWRR